MKKLHFVPFNQTPYVSACVYCSRSHAACDDQRPCQRCKKRGIAHLCHDQPKKKRGRAVRSVQEEAAAAAAASAPPPTTVNPLQNAPLPTVVPIPQHTIMTIATATTATTTTTTTTTKAQNVIENVNSPGMEAFFDEFLRNCAPSPVPSQSWMPPPTPPPPLQTPPLTTARTTISSTYAMPSTPSSAFTMSAPPQKQPAQVPPPTAPLTTTTPPKIATISSPPSSSGSPAAPSNSTPSTPALVSSSPSSTQELLPMHLQVDVSTPQKPPPLHVLRDVVKNYDLLGHEKEFVDLMHVMISYECFISSLKGVFGGSTSGHVLAEAYKASSSLADLPVPSFVCINGVRILAANQAACNLCNHPESDLLGLAFFQLVHPEDIMQFFRSGIQSYCALTKPGPTKMILRIRQENIIVNGYPPGDATTGGVGALQANISVFERSLKSQVNKFCTCVVMRTIYRDELNVPMYSVYSCMRVDDLST